VWIWPVPAAQAAGIVDSSPVMKLRHPGWETRPPRCVGVDCDESGPPWAASRVKAAGDRPGRTVRHEVLKDDEGTGTVLESWVRESFCLLGARRGQPPKPAMGMVRKLENSSIWSLPAKQSKHGLSRESLTGRAGGTARDTGSLATGIGGREIGQVARLAKCECRGFEWHTCMLSFDRKPGAAKIEHLNRLAAVRRTANRRAGNPRYVPVIGDSDFGEVTGRARFAR
jgi:hypothetical protein